MNLMISMAAFALAASISPGPVNVVALSSGAQFGLGASLRHVMGATVGFVALLVFTGLGLHEVLHRYPMLTDVIRWAGMAFLLYLAWKLAVDDGRLNVDRPVQPPSFWHGAAMQWLNPKAWLAAVAGMGAFVADGEARLIGLFALIYFVICYLSVACWAGAGAFLGPWLRSPSRIRTFNRSMAALLAGCAMSLLYV
ncbi:LysE family translocator [Pseudomonas sp. GD03842]|uniref:LysE family translocator n=1 Tax=unclassified Pseudomonas TaxID=196821 RepID=UPI000D348635|nr:MULTISPECIES: LysE family translocator [unclassified Pseudomonas]MDH0748640.1 LysE family translocator [Pseudomonas sp. GD03842]RAU44295.1 LysE family translocator [Pseudomonas sp. RIT 409]RAU51058.1 LysE family translocator [Pseudomonas sp. RIT 412]